MSRQPTTREAVACVLAEEGPMSPSELVQRVDRTPRSIRYALRELEDEGAVAWRFDPTDTRYRRYRLTSLAKAGTVDGACPCEAAAAEG